MTNPITLIKEWVVAVKNYITANFDHFMISLGVSIVVTVVANVFAYHLGFWLHLFHLPLPLIHWLGYK